MAGELYLNEAIFLKKSSKRRYNKVIAQTKLRFSVYHTQCLISGTTKNEKNGWCKFRIEGELKFCLIPPSQLAIKDYVLRA